MDYALTKLPYDRPGASEPFTTPDTPSNYADLAPVLRGAWAGGESFFIDTVSGKLATENTPKETRQELVIPDPHNITYWINPSNPTGPRPANPANFSQYNRWEKEFQSWIANHPSLVPGYPIKPSEYDDVHTDTNKPITTIVSPSPGVTLSLNATVTIQTQITSNYPIKSTNWYLNDVFIGSSTTNSFSFIPANSNGQPGVNQLKIITIDAAYNKGELTSPIIFQ